MPVLPVRAQPGRRPVLLSLVLITGLTVLACAGVGNVTSDIGAAATAAAAIGSQAAGLPTPSAGGATAAPVVQSSAKCQTLGAAFIDLQSEYPLLAMGSDDAYAHNTPDSPTYINTAKLLADLDVLATLPDGELGATAPAIAQIRALINQVDANIKSGGKPFSDGSGDGQKVLDMYLKLAAPYTTVSAAFAGACPHYSAPTAAPAVAGFQIGQTATVGDLSVTLDKVSQAPLDQGNLAQPGNRFLLVHVTITNTGQTALQVTALAETNLQDAAGNNYGFDPFANSTAAVTSDNGLDGEVPAGGTRAGLIGYQLPSNAGDLLWTFHDYAQKSAIFAVKVSDIDISAAGSAPTEDALRAAAGATATEFMRMVQTADAAPTDTPQP
jgi:hypothetical protein